MLGGSGVIHWVIFQPGGGHIAVAGVIANAGSTAKCRAGVVSASGLGGNGVSLPAADAAGKGVSASGLRMCLRIPERWLPGPKELEGANRGPM